jgi:ribosomal protein S18 acetylase RimI-like enzyme
VHADAHGRGVAQALMEHVLGRAAPLDADVAWLGVWERNPRAIAFYRKQGFEAVGEQVAA